MKPSEMAKRFRWWWRDPDLEFIVTGNSGATKMNPKWAKADGPHDTILARHGSAIFRLSDRKRAFFQVWKYDGGENAAHCYELVRRLPSNEKLPVWPDLSEEQRQALITAVGNSRDSIEVIHSGDANGIVRIRRGSWTMPIQWNVRARDYELEERFKELKTFISSERRRLGIRQRKSIGRNSVSWRWIEIWDQGNGLNASETSSLSRAKKRAKEVEKTVLSALTEAKS